MVFRIGDQVVVDSDSYSITKRGWKGVITDTGGVLTGTGGSRVEVAFYENGEEYYINENHLKKIDTRLDEVTKWLK